MGQFIKAVLGVARPGQGVDTATLSPRRPLNESINKIVVKKEGVVNIY